MMQYWVDNSNTTRCSTG